MRATTNLSRPDDASPSVKGDVLKIENSTKNPTGVAQADRAGRHRPAHIIYAHLSASRRIRLMRLEEVQTPALILNLDAAERNLRRMAAECASANIALRPHTKTHKSPWLAARQIQLGAVGVCTAKVGEAEVMARAGIGDILITTEPIPSNIHRVLSLASMAKVTVVADSAELVDELSRKTSARRFEISVLVDVNVGQDRTGSAPGDAALQLARVIADARGLRFAGLQGYEGHCQHIRDYEERRSRAFECYDRLAMTRELILSHDIPVPCITTAGTGTYQMAIEHGTATEVQPGSYVAMDCDYSSVQRTEFENALFILTSVISTNRPDLQIIDAGKKAVSTDAGLPIVKDQPEARYQAAGDEHGKILGMPRMMALGDQVLLIPSHCDTTINLYDQYVLIRDDGRIEGTLAVEGRGKST
jgi:D-serine deaminase-like pyridoxal phosphate-dependent protein